MVNVTITGGNVHLFCFTVQSKSENGHNKSGQIILKFQTHCAKQGRTCKFFQEGAEGILEARTPGEVRLLYCGKN